MNEEDEKELERRRLAEKVRQTVELELKRRYSWIGLIIAVVMGSFITLTVNQLLSGATAQLKVMTELGQRAEQRLEEAFSESRAFSRELAATAETNLGLIDDIRSRVSELNVVVNSLTTTVYRSRGTDDEGAVDPELQKKITDIGTELEKSGEDIEKAMRQVGTPLQLK